MKQETVSGSVVSWTICTSVPHSGQLTMPVPHHSGQMPFLQCNQQRQSTEDSYVHAHKLNVYLLCARRWQRRAWRSVI